MSCHVCLLLRLTLVLVVKTSAVILDRRNRFWCWLCCHPAPTSHSRNRHIDNMHMQLYCSF